MLSVAFRLKESIIAKIHLHYERIEIALAQK